MVPQTQPTLAEAAYGRIEHLIATLELGPGNVFSEADLCALLELGRTPVREALQRLASQGLIRVMPRRGMMVAPVDLRDMLAIIETRKALDRLVARGVAERASGPQRARIRAALQDLAGEGSTFMEADGRLDEAIWTAAPNQFAVQAVRPLHTHCRRLWYRYHEAEDAARSAELHKAVVHAILEGDGLAAEQRSDKLMDYLALFTKHILISA
ncbi:MAG: GntR family transcriptional regulator [Rhodothermales bacterium]|nr:GntR family transcriptional regulator [Rhodothermales bacterium]MBO6778921.1 GntR family transcriptional regulator [Rhodothermales bacterium]